MTGVLLQENCCPEACCLPDGTCADRRRADCIEQGGTPQGCGTKCADPDIECGDVQACCFEGGDCQDLVPADCVAAGGIPQGKGTSCLDVNCVLCDTAACAACLTTLSVSITGFRADYVDGGIACEVTGITIATRVGGTCAWPGDDTIGDPPCEFIVTLACFPEPNPDFVIPLPAGWIVEIHTQGVSPAVAYTRGPPTSQCPPFGVYDLVGIFEGPSFIIVDPGICEVL